MKKNCLRKLTVCFFTSALLFAAAPLFASGSEDFHADMDSALAAAKKSSKALLIFITQEGEDQLSESFMKTVNKPEVFNRISSSYEPVLMDFTQKSFEKTVVRDTDSAEEQAKAKVLADIMQKNSRFAALINPEFTPAVYLFSKEGYYVSHLVLKGDEDAAGFLKALSDDEVKLNALNQMVAKTKAGKPLEKVAAIDELLEATQPEYRFFLIDMVNTAIGLDKKNKSGLMNKYLITRAEYDVTMAYYDNNAPAAVNTYVNLAKEKFLSGEEKQRSYYMAALIMIKSSGAESLPMIIAYLEKAIAAAPASADVAKLKENLDYFKDYQAKMNAAQAAGGKQDSQDGNK